MYTSWAVTTTIFMVTAGWSCGGPITVPVKDGSTYEQPQAVGVINTSDGTEFSFNSTVGGMTAVVRFQVPATRTHEIRYGGRDLFDIYLRLSQMTGSLANFEHGVWTSVSLDSETDYYLEIDQIDNAMMGATLVAIQDE